ncbi:MAG: hypothetical protein GXY45_10610 [Ramlibacter sp.]|nr:hypothetical protein [Ramlibacter sp.]
MQQYLDVYKTPDGVVDYYKVLSIPYNATPDQIEDAFLYISADYLSKESYASHEERAKYVLAKMGYSELSSPQKRKKYDSLLKAGFNHMRLLAAIEAERQKKKIEDHQANTPEEPQILQQANTRGKRIALVAAPFFGVAAIFRLMRDNDYGDPPSALFVLLAMATILCLLVALTRLGDWLGKQ